MQIPSVPRQLTGNHWLTLPCINPADGAVHAIGVLHRGARAAIEFAVRVLGVRRIVVLAHAGCGGVKALFDGAPPEVSDFVVSWMGIAERARSEVDPALEGEERSRAGEQACVGVTMENLMSFPWIRERVEQGELEITGMHFGVATGCLRCRDDRGFWADVPAN